MSSGWYFIVFAHIEIFVTFLVLEILFFLDIARHHEVGDKIWRIFFPEASRTFLNPPGQSKTFKNPKIYETNLAEKTTKVNDYLLFPFERCLFWIRSLGRGTAPCWHADGLGGVWHAGGSSAPVAKLMACKGPPQYWRMYTLKSGRWLRTGSSPGQGPCGS